MVRVALDHGSVSVEGGLVWSRLVRNPRSFSLLLLLLAGLRSRLLLELTIFGLLSTPVVLVLCHVDFSDSSFDLDTDRNIGGNILMASFVKSNTE